MYTESSENDLTRPAHGPYTQGMPKRTTPSKPPVKIPKNFRLYPEDIRRLKLGAEKMSIPTAIYLQFALREKFEKDGID